MKSRLLDKIAFRVKYLTFRNYHRNSPCIEFFETVPTMFQWRGKHVLIVVKFIAFVLFSCFGSVFDKNVGVSFPFCSRNMYS